jgi:hypothetical protein
MAYEGRFTALTVLSMLEDPNISHLISWSNSDESFVMSPSNDFSKVLSYVSVILADDQILTITANILNIQIYLLSFDN